MAARWPGSIPLAARNSTARLPTACRSRLQEADPPALIVFFAIPGRKPRHAFHGIALFCFYAIPDRKPLHTFLGIAPERRDRCICVTAFRPMRPSGSVTTIGSIRA
ncbi:MAG: hypothetical protein EOR08_27745 [Mesorhizobium sp.]|nr:MAG: hypothetical protein EOR08_27745 [Mesorhizobium sp.]